MFKETKGNKVLHIIGGSELRPRQIKREVERRAGVVDGTLWESGITRCKLLYVK